VIIKRVVSVFKAGGVVAVLAAVARRLRTPHARTFPLIREVVRDAAGMEIGGPSPMFARGGLIPIYPLARQIDNVNFARNTIWEGAIAEGDSFTFHPGKPAGRQIFAEGADLAMVPAGRYDFVLSSHMIEHTANPLRALAGWGRLLRPGGALILVAPHRDGTFDHRRPVTTLAHLVADFEHGTGEDDLTHLAEVLDLHDVSRDPGVADAAAFRERASRNAEIRSLHHHVFDTRLAVAAVGLGGFEVVAVEPLAPYHIVVVARKPGTGDVVRPATDSLLSAALRGSPFRTDRQGS
jgi:SAM-dependent methyltransferase